MRTSVGASRRAAMGTTPNGVGILCSKRRKSVLSKVNDREYAGSNSPEHDRRPKLSSASRKHTRRRRPQSAARIYDVSSLADSITQRVDCERATRFLTERSD